MGNDADTHTKTHSCDTFMVGAFQVSESQGSIVGFCSVSLVRPALL